MSLLSNLCLVESEQIEVDASDLLLTKEGISFMANIILTDLPKTRQAAKESGSKQYFDNSVCNAGHISERYTGDAKCCRCVRDRQRLYSKNNREIIKEKSKIFYSQNREKITSAGRARHHKNKARMNAISKEYYRTNKERVLEEAKEYHSKNKEKRNEYSKQYRQSNKEKIYGLSRKWYLENKTRHYALQKKYRNTEKGRATSKTYRKESPEIIKAARHKRRALEMKAQGFFTSEDIKRIKAQQNNKCAYCKCRLNGDHQIDHIHPLSKGGSNWPSNLQMLCKPCNSKKRAKLPDEWAKENGLLL